MQPLQPRLPASLLQPWQHSLLSLSLLAPLPPTRRRCRVRSYIKRALFKVVTCLWMQERHSACPAHLFKSCPSALADMHQLEELVTNQGNPSLLATFQTMLGMFKQVPIYT